MTCGFLRMCYIFCILNTFVFKVFSLTALSREKEHLVLLGAMDIHGK